MSMLPIEPGQPGFQMDPIFSQQINVPQPANRGGMFGGGGKFGLKEALAFGLAGLVSRRNPALLQGLMTAAMQRQKQAQEDAQYQQRRSDSLVDYEAKQKIDQRYPTAPQPTEYERMLQAAGIMPGTPEYIQHVKSYVDMKENPPYYFTDPTTGRLMSMPRNGGGMGAPASPGVTFTPIDEGGPSLGGSGGFL